MRKSAFTLIELLVVIAIIAILAAILFPVFAQAKDAAKKSVGLSNVKQLGTGYALYLQDNDDVFPQSVTERTSPNYATATRAEDVADYSIRAKLGPYTKSGNTPPTATSNQGGIWKDPSANAWPVATTKQWWSVDYGSNSNEANLPLAVYHDRYNSSADNYGLADFGFNETTSATSLALPANFIVLGDAARADGSSSRGGLYPQPWAFDDSAGHVNGSSVDPNGSYQARLWPRHGDRKLTYPSSGSPSGTGGAYASNIGGVNICYGDFHAKWRNTNQTWRSWYDNDWRRNPTQP